MKNALLTGLTAVAIGVTGSLALSGPGSAASTTPLGVTAPSADPCAVPGADAPSCVVEDVLRLQTPAPTASADDDGTPDQGRGDVAVAPAAPARPATDDDGTPDQGRGDVAVAPAAPARPAAPAVKLRGDGSVDDTQPGARATTSASGDDDGTPDQGRGDRPAARGDDRDDDRDDDRSGRRGGDDRDDDRSGHGGGDDRDDDSSSGGDDDGTADQGSGDR